MEIIVFDYARTHKERKEVRNRLGGVSLAFWLVTLSVVTGGRPPPLPPPRLVPSVSPPPHPRPARRLAANRIDNELGLNLA